MSKRDERIRRQAQFELLKIEFGCVVIGVVAALMFAKAFMIF